MRLRVWVWSAVLAVTALAAARPARGGIDIEITNGDKVFGTLNPSSEIEQFRVRVPQGARLLVSVKGKKTGKNKPPAVTVNLFDESQQEVGTPVQRGKGAKLLVDPVAATGEYSVVVTSLDGSAGDYFLKVAWKAQKKYVETVDTSVGPAPKVTIIGDAGATVNAIVKTTKRSDALPRLVAVNGLDVLADQPFDPSPDPSARSHRGRITLDGTGRFDVSTLDGGTAGGKVTLVVKVVKPKNRRKVRLTSNELGALGLEGRDEAQGGIVGPAGGSVFFDGGGLSIDGAGIDVPPGALGAPTPIIVGTAPDIDPGALQGAGPTVYFAPEGQEFSQAATLTMPFDTGPFDASFTGLGVLVSDAGGNVTQVTEDITVDGNAGTVSFATTHFSSYRVVAPAIPVAVAGDVTGDGVADLLLPSAAAGSVLEASVFVFAGGAGFPGAPALTTADAAARLFDDAAGSARFGVEVATGDLNGDGIEDPIVVDDTDGKGYVFFGGPAADRGAAAADLTLAGTGGFGRNVAIGDLDDDGVPDALVGAPFDAGSQGGNPGTALTFAGRLNHTVTQLMDGSPGVRKFTGDTDGDEFGFRVAIGDVTGDGKPDVIVAAPRLGRSLAGVVYVFPGGANLVDRNVSVLPPPIVITGQLPSDQFGDALAVADVNGDGTDDLIVGAPGHSNDAFLQGAVFVFYGGPRLFLQESGTTADRRWEGSARDDLFGNHVAAGDVNGDGIADVIAGAPGADPGSVNRAGEVYVFLGGPDKGKAALVASGFASVAPVRIAGENADDQLGALERPLDLNGDGTLDLILIAPFFGADEGRTYVFTGGAGLASGAASTAQQTITGRAGERLGDPFAVRAP